MEHDDHEPNGRSRSFWRSRFAIGLLLFAAIALFFLLTEHRAHTLGALPYVLLLASPLLHIFMHRGHSHGHGHARDDNGPSDDRAASPEASAGRSRKAHHHH